MPTAFDPKRARVLSQDANSFGDVLAAAWLEDAVRCALTLVSSPEGAPSIFVLGSAWEMSTSWQRSVQQLYLQWLTSVETCGILEGTVPFPL